MNHGYILILSLDLRSMYRVTFVWHGNGTCNIRHIPLSVTKSGFVRIRIFRQVKARYILNTTISPVGINLRLRQTL